MSTIVSVRLDTKHGKRKLKCVQWILVEWVSVNTHRAKLTPGGPWKMRFQGEISFFRNHFEGITSRVKHHYNDVIMTTMASQITSLTVVYSSVYSDADQRKDQSFAPLAFVWGIHRDQWIPRTKGQLRGNYFHLMASSCYECMERSDINI